MCVGRVLPLHDSAEIFTVKMAAWHNEVDAVRSWYQAQHDNWSTVAADRSRWWVWNAVLDITRKSVVQVQTYLQRITEGRPIGSRRHFLPVDFCQVLPSLGRNSWWGSAKTVDNINP